MKYGDRLKELRIRKGLSQQEFANRINMNRSTYSRYETSSTQPDYETLEKIADFYDVTVDYILGRPEVNSEKDKSERDKIIHKIATEFPDIDLMFHDLANMSADDLQDVYDYIKFKKSKKS